MILLIISVDLSSAIAIMSVLLAGGGIIYSAGILGAKIAQNERDINELKNFREIESQQKSQSNVHYENRLTAIEVGIRHMSEKIDLFIEALKK